MATPSISNKNNRAPWVIFGALGCVAICLLIALVGMGAFWILNPARASTTPPSPTQPIAQVFPTVIATRTSTPLPASPTATRTSTPLPASPTITLTPTPAFNAQGVRFCVFVPGLSTPAVMPPSVVNLSTPTPFPNATLPAPTQVEASITSRQLNVYRDLWNRVNQFYVYTDFNGYDWKAIGTKYEALIRQGITDDMFFALMNTMIGELGDDHSSFVSPQRVKEDDETAKGTHNYVGIGTMNISLPEGERAVVVSVFPNSPADQAGIRPHDIFLQVDGGPIWDKNRLSRTLGIEGTLVTVTLQHPGQAPINLTMTRRAVTGAMPINYCLIPNTRIGYIFIPTFLEDPITTQVREALKKMTADGNLDGLILDNRMNGGGQEKVALGVMNFFLGGAHGRYVSRTNQRELRLTPEDIGGSQKVPLVVLVGVNTVSYGEIFSGVLQNAGRAKIIGQTSYGNVELLRPFDFADGSRAWIASETFEPAGLRLGIWEQTGIIPDVFAPARWDLFTEASDPALAKALELLMRK